MRFAFSISLRKALFVLMLMSGLSITTHAQFRASIQGAVTDPNGAAVPGTTVTLTNKETNRVQQTTTSGEGFYRFDQLAPGSYTITAELSGFKKKLLEDVQVKAEEAQGVNIQLETGDVAETVTITDLVTEQLQTESANIDGSFSKQEVLRLPQVGRDPYELARLAPGVFGLGARNAGRGAVRLPNTAGPGGSNSSIFQTENQVPISANGQRTAANNFEVDGVSVNSQAWGGAAVLTPNQESVKEVRVVSSSYSAEHGRNTGALIQVVSQNGTNDFHGSVFYKYQDPTLNAFNKWGGPAPNLRPQRVEQRFRQFGGSIGGPIYLPRFGEGGPAYWSGKNKLFFFFSYEALNNREPNRISLNTSETPEFRALVIQQRPGSNAARILSQPGIAPLALNVVSFTCAQFAPTLNATNCREVPGRGVDLGSPTGVRGQRVTNRLGGGFDGIPDVVRQEVSNPRFNEARQYNTRIDFQATSNDLVAFSLYYTPNNNTFLMNERPMMEFNSFRRNTAGALLWTRTLSSTMVNEARFNVTRWYFDEVTSNSELPFGLPRTFVTQDHPFVQFSPGGVGVFYQTSYNFRDILSKVWGNHGFKFGGEFAAEQNNDTSAGRARPEYRFINMWNFVNDAPDSETSNRDPRTGHLTDTKKYIRVKVYSLFAQDDWKARPNLTLNLGLRWEYFAPPKEKFGNLGNLILGEGAQALTGARFVIGEPLHEPDRNNFGPQLGFAWSPGRFKDKAVLRGGFGVGFNKIPQAITLGARTNPPFVAGFTITDLSQIVYSLAPSVTSFSGFPPNPSTILQFNPATNIPFPRPGAALPDVFSTGNDAPNPYTYRYSLEGQYDLGDWVASVGYQGSTGRKFPRVVNLALFVTRNPNLGASQRVLLSDVNTNFNALLTRLTRRFSKGFDFTAQYRWSKSIDTCSDDANCAQSFPFDQSTERGPSDYDVTHAFTAAGLWDLPILRNRRDFIAKALGGWQLSGIVTASSGFPWTPVNNANCTTLTDRGFVCPLRPIAYLGGLEQDTSNAGFQRGTFGPGAASRFISAPTNTAAAVPPPPGIGRNVFRGPGYFNVDMSVIKRFGLPGFLGEQAGLDIRANVFNVFNNLNLAPFEFNSVSTQINSVEFGRAQRALQGRVIEFQGRFSF